MKKALEPCLVLPSPEKNERNIKDDIPMPTLITDEPVSASCVLSPQIIDFNNEI